MSQEPIACADVTIRALSKNIIIKRQRTNTGWKAHICTFVYPKSEKTSKAFKS